MGNVKETSYRRDASLSAEPYFPFLAESTQVAPTATVRGEFGEVATSMPLIARAGYRYSKRLSDRETFPSIRVFRSIQLASVVKDS